MRTSKRAVAGAVWGTALGALLVWGSGCSAGAEETPASHEDAVRLEHVGGKPDYVRARPLVWERVDIPEGLVEAAAERPFQKGDLGAGPAWIRDRLEQYGYVSLSLEQREMEDKLRPDIELDGWTELALASFQAWNGIEEEGLLPGHAGPQTLRALAGIPERTESGFSKLEGGDCTYASLQTEGDRAAFLMRLFDEANVETNVPRNEDPEGVNFVQIRGFVDGCAVQNVHDRYNDDLFAVINDDDGLPARVRHMRASVDYGTLKKTLPFFGIYRPKTEASVSMSAWPTMGDSLLSDKALGISRPGQVVSYFLGRHGGKDLQGREIDRGLALIDPQGVAGNPLRAAPDFNHNGEIDGPEWNYSIVNVGNNVHRGAEHTNGLTEFWSAGCGTLPVDGPYQDFTEIVLNSGQVRSYIQNILDTQTVREHLVKYLVFGERRQPTTTDGFIEYAPESPLYDESLRTHGVFMGPRDENGPMKWLPRVKFPFAIVDARSIGASEGS